MAARVQGSGGLVPRHHATHQYIDAMAMFLVKDPAQYQVIVTNNLFGDIVTDIGGALQGGLGMAASGNIHPGRTSLFEPVHGSAPPLAGKNVANPIGAILSTALMLETLGARDESRADRSAPSKRRSRPARPRPTSAARSARAKSATGIAAADQSVERMHAVLFEFRTDRELNMSRPVFILGGARTPMTTYVGALKDFSAIDLGAIASRGGARTHRRAARVDRSRRVRQRAADQRRCASTARATSGSRPACRSRCRR